MELKMTAGASLPYIAIMCTSLFFASNIKPAKASDKNGFSFDGQLEALVGSDSNVVVEEIDFATSTRDTFVTLRGKFDLAYEFTDNHSASGSVSLTDQKYSKADNFDLLTSLGAIGYKFEHSGYTFNIDYRQADAQLGGNQFLILKQLSPSVSFFVNKKNFVRVAYTNSEKELASNPMRDATSDDYALNYYYFWKGLNDYFISAISFRDEDALDPEFSFSAYQLRLAYKKRFSLIGYRSRLTIDGRYRQRDFDNTVNPNIDEFRVDKRTTFRITNEVAFTEDLSWQVEVEYISNNSNLNAINFNETQLITGISYKF